MKKLIAILFLSIASLSFADCSSSGLFFWPKTKTVGQNSIFIIEGYAASKRIIGELGTSYPVYLKSKNHTVRLLVSEYHESGFNLAQSIMRPEEKLHPGESYTLFIEGIDDNSPQGVLEWNYESRKKELVSWNVENSNEPEVLTFKSEPKYLGGAYTGFGCGPDIHSYFKITSENDSPALVFVSLTDLESLETTEYYIPYAVDLIPVGHGMCSGEFNIEVEKRYSITFRLMDASGKVSSRTSNPIYFNGPTLDEQFVFDKSER